MTNIVFMHVLYGRENLLHDHSCLIFCQKLFLSDVVEKLVPLAKLLNKEYPLLILIDVKQLHDIRVIQLLHYGYLIFKCGNILNSLFPDCLYCSHFQCFSIFCQVYYTVGTRSKLFSELVVFTNIPAKEIYRILFRDFQFLTFHFIFKM